MSRDIKSFNNGIDVDAVVDKMTAGDKEALSQFFKEAAGAEFLVPFKGSPNNLAILNSPEGDKMLPAFSSYEAFEKCPLEKKNAIIMPFSRLDKIVGGEQGRRGWACYQPARKIHCLQKAAEHRSDLSEKRRSAKL